jgi:ABC-type transporter Mla subunit MlaD
MRRNSPLRGAFSNPTMVGAVTVLITVLAVFLAYNANSGLPFVSSYRVTASVPDAEGLVPGNEVRVGGVRVGQIEAIDPITAEDGSVHAALRLKLDQTVDPLPVDSTVIIRARSALGLKYLEVARGDSETPEPVEFDELLNTFDEPTQVAIQRNLVEFGNALAGRGPDLNEAIGELNTLLPRLERVAAGLADPDTGLGNFFRALTQAAAEVAPVAEQQAQMFVNLDVTLAAFADIARPYLQETISRSPETLLTASETLPRIRPFIANSAGFFNDLAPGAAALRTSADDIEAALLAGIPALRKSPILNAQLPPTAASLRAFNDDDEVRTGLNRLIDLSESLSPTLRYVAPAQSVCNYASLLLRNASDLTSIGNELGNWQRFILLDTPKGPNNEGSPSSGPASGGGDDPRNFLHVNPYPNTASPGQTKECEAGNEEYQPGVVQIGNSPGNQGTATEPTR